MGRVVRTAVAYDARDIAKLHVGAWQVAYRDLMPRELLDQLSVQEREHVWHERLNKPDRRSLTLVVQADSGIDGFCHVATPSRDYDATSDLAEIAAIYVAPSRWRAGVGSMLMNAALDELRGRGYRAVTLWVLTRHDAARAFYSTFSFQPDGVEAIHERSGQRETRLCTPLLGADSPTL